MGNTQTQVPPTTDRDIRAWAQRRLIQEHKHDDLPGVSFTIVCSRPDRSLCYPETPIQLTLPEPKPVEYYLERLIPAAQRRITEIGDKIAFSPDDPRCTIRLPNFFEAFETQNHRWSADFIKRAPLNIMGIHGLHLLVEVPVPGRQL